MLALRAGVCQLIDSRTVLFDDPGAVEITSDMRVCIESGLPELIRRCVGTVRIDDSNADMWQATWCTLER
jgi:hypothetical protein